MSSVSLYLAGRNDAMPYARAIRHDLDHKAAVIVVQNGTWHRPEEGKAFTCPSSQASVFATGYGWADPFGFAPDMADDHVFEIEQISECLTRFKQYDAFTGVGPKASEITTAFISQDAMGVYRIFNAELKAAVEAKSAN